MDLDGTKIAQRIKRRAAALGMSMGEFYKKSKISSALLSQWNTGAQNPTPPKIAAAAKALETDVEYLMFGEKEKAAPINGGGTDETIDELIRIAQTGTIEERQRLLEIAKLVIKE